jgi:hypothetical protein
MMLDLPARLSGAQIQKITSVGGGLVLKEGSTPIS